MNHETMGKEYSLLWEVKMTCMRLLVGPTSGSSSVWLTPMCTLQPTLLLSQEWIPDSSFDCWLGNFNSLSTLRNPTVPYVLSLLDWSLLPYEPGDTKIVPHPVALSRLQYDIRVTSDKHCMIFNNTNHSVCAPNIISFFAFILNVRWMLISYQGYYRNWIWQR